MDNTCLQGSSQVWHSFLTQQRLRVQPRMWFPCCHVLAGAQASSQTETAVISSVAGRTSVNTLHASQ